MTKPSDADASAPLPPGGWAHVRSLVEQALALPREARPAFLDASCRDDALRRRVERLAAACERDGEGWAFLAHPAGALAAPLLTAAEDASPGRPTPGAELGAEHGASATRDLLGRVTAALADRYRIARELGTGGMATVYLAHDVRHARPVAVKVLRPELSAVLGADRFLSEIRTTAALQHPHILPLFDSGTAAGLLFYVMPLVEGGTLRARLARERQLPVADAVRIATELAGALDYAHRRGVIHRDIKPENVLLHEGRPVLADFGIALAAPGAGVGRVARPGHSPGTPEYMSPEQTTGEQEVTTRSDIYALGVVAYEMLAGEPPFTGATVRQIVTRVRTEEPRAIAARRRHVPPHVAAAVHTALEKLPADRFESASGFARALADPAFGGAVRHDAGAAAPPGARREHRGLVRTLAALVVALAVLATWGWARAPRVTGDVVRFVVPVPRGLSIATTSATGSIAVSPDGKVVVFSASAADGTRRLYARALDEVASRTLAGTEGASDPFFSPDGRWIGFWSRGRLHKVASEGGLPQALATTPAGKGATWTRNDVIVFASAGGLYSLPAAGGTPALLSAPDGAAGETTKIYPVALPDGDHVLYSSLGRDGASIGLASLSARSGRSLGIPGTSALGVVDGLLIYATRDNVLMAVPLDASAGRTTGAAVAVDTEVSVGVVGSAKAALSRSGTLVYRDEGRTSRMVLAGGTGDVEVVLPEPRAYAFPRFSPDGSRIAVSVDAGTRSDVWLHDLGSRTWTRVSSGGSANDRPEWTPDGARVLYRTDEGTETSIRWRAADLSGPAVPLLGGGSTAVFEAVITPDGGAVVYQVDNDVKVRALAADAIPEVVAASVNIENQARVSPDGRWVAFVTDESGSDEVVVQPFRTSGVRVQVSSNGGAEPVWSRDGRRLFYRANRQFMAATVVTAPSFAVASRVVLFADRFVSAAAPHANYDVSPDGRRLLVLDAADEPRIVVVHNWGAGVRSRLAGRVSRE